MEYWKVVLSNYLPSEETLWLMNLKSDAAQNFQGDFWRNRLITLFWCSAEIGKYAQQLFLCNSNIFIWGLAAHILQTLAADLSPLFEANLTNSFFLQIPIWGHYCKVIQTFGFCISWIFSKYRFYHYMTWIVPSPPNSLKSCSLQCELKQGKAVLALLTRS